MKYIVDIKGEIEGDYEIIGKYDEVLKRTDIEKQAILLLINSGWLVNHDKELRKKWERPQGEWIVHSCYKDVIICSNCNSGDNRWHKDFKFCPNCGAKMLKGGAV